jgi:tetratricopeptide (TPR) repeat protein
MRGILIGSAVLAGWLASCPGARAGLYLSTENTPLLAPENMKLWIGQLRNIANERKGQTPGVDDLRPKYLGEVERLEALRREGPFSPVDRADLGACYVRLGKPGKAISVLREADQDHFLVRANLATAYFVQGELRMALRYQQRLLAGWPSVWAGWSNQQHAWQRRAETYFLKLLVARLEEERRAEARGAGFGGKEIPLDRLFPGLKFVGPSGRYEAGALAPEMWDRLPPDASNIVLQLILWAPGDYRLYWLLGELLNVYGHVEPAYAILAELVNAGVDFQGLREHRKVLDQVVKAYKAWRPPPGTSRPMETPGLLLSALTAPTPLAPGPAGAASHQAAAAATYAWALVPRPEPAEEPPPETPARTRPFDWWHLLIAFGVGALVSALLALQWHEWRRRRPAPSAPPPPHGEAAPTDRPVGTGVTRGRPR